MATEGEGRDSIMSKREIRKDMKGDMATTREFPIEQFGDRQPDAAEAPLGGFDDVSTRLGNMRVLGTRDNVTITPYDVPGNMVAAPDAFLRSKDEDAMIGGANKPYAQGGKFWSEEAGAYVMNQPDADAREDMNFAAGGDAMIPGPANAQFPDAGTIGGREPSSYVVKRGKATGLFRDVVFRGGDQAASFIPGE